MGKGLTKPFPYGIIDLSNERKVVNIMARENIEKIERKRFQKKLAIAIEWLELLETNHDADVLQLDYDELKSVRDSIKFLKSLN